jgi:hypothetical protein
MRPCREILTEALRAYGTAKELALAGGFSVNTAERYRRGEGLPDVLALTRLMGKSRLIAEAVLRMAGLDDLSLDQEQARLVRSLAELEAKRARRHAGLAQAYAVAGITPPAQAGRETGAARAAAAAADRPADGAVAPEWPAAE